MSKEGYLIYHEENRRSTICYCILGEGKLRLLSEKEDGCVLKEVNLSKSKLKIRGVQDDEARNCAFSFSVLVQRSKIRDGVQVTFGKPVNLILSAPSWSERRSWGNVIHAWQRNYWGEPQHKLSNMDEEETEFFFAEQYQALEKSLRNTPLPVKPKTISLLRGRRMSVPNSLKNVRKSLPSAHVSLHIPNVRLNLRSSIQQKMRG